MVLDKQSKCYLGKKPRAKFFIFNRFCNFCLAHFILVFLFFRILVTSVAWFSLWFVPFVYFFLPVLHCNRPVQDKQKITQYFCISVTTLTKTKNGKWYEINTNREDKTIESAVPFPAPFHPLFEKALSFPENHWSVWKTSLVLLPCYRGGDREGDPFIQCIKGAYFHYFINLTWPTFTAASTVQFAVVILLEKKTRFQDMYTFA